MDFTRHLLVIIIQEVINAQVGVTAIFTSAIDIAPSKDVKSKNYVFLMTPFLVIEVTTRYPQSGHYSSRYKKNHIIVYNHR